MEVAVPFGDPDFLPDDDCLISGLRKGDPSALRAIYLSYKDDLFTAARIVLGDPSGAEDCLHDVFVNLASSASRLRIRSSLKGYLFTCVANRAKDMIRMRSRTVADLGDGRDPPSRDEPSLARMVRGEQSRELAAALEDLADVQREVIVLHLHGGLTFKEIAEHSGESINTVQSRYRYGLGHLRDVLGEDPSHENRS
jgi:RNA polymerase sigma-70 factor, ECF subfamily